MNTETWSMLLGLVVMLVTSLTKNPTWTRTQKTLLMGGVSAAAAVVQLYMAGQLKFDHDFMGNLGTNVSVIIATSTLLYNLHFNKTAANAKLEAVGYRCACGKPGCTCAAGACEC